MDTVRIEAVEIPFIPETYLTKKTLVQECCFAQNQNALDYSKINS